MPEKIDLSFNAPGYINPGGVDSYINSASKNEENITKAIQGVADEQYNRDVLNEKLKQIAIENSRYDEAKRVSDASGDLLLNALKTNGIMPSNVYDAIMSYPDSSIRSYVARQYAPAVVQDYYNKLAHDRQKELLSLTNIYSRDQLRLASALNQANNGTVLGTPANNGVLPNGTGKVDEGNTVYLPGNLSTVNITGTDEKKN